MWRAGRSAHRSVKKLGEVANWRSCTVGRRPTLVASRPRIVEPTVSLARYGASHAARRSGESSAGFTLIELVIVTAVLPIVIGAIAVGVISVFSLQSSVSNRLTDSGDAEVIAY